MNIKDVENLAELARLELSHEEKEGMLHDMDGILAYVKQIEEVEVEDIKSDPELKNVWREDEVAERDYNKDSITAQFPDSKDGFLKVKKIL